MPAAGSGPMSIVPPDREFWPPRLPVEPAVPVAALLPPVSVARGEPPAVPFGSSTGTSVEPMAGGPDAGAAVAGPGASRLPVSAASWTEVGPAAVDVPPDSMPGINPLAGGLMTDVLGWAAAPGVASGIATRTADGPVAAGRAPGAAPVPV